MKPILALLIFVLCSGVQAETTTKRTFPVIYDTTTFVKSAEIKTGDRTYDDLIPLMSNSKNQVIGKKTSSSAPVEVEKVSELVTSIREAICSGIKKGSFKVWLKFDANTKVFGVGSSTEGGIEVNVACS